MTIPWKYNGKIVKEPPEGAIAFVYYLEFEDGHRYIGKKNLWSTSRKKVPGRKNRKVTRKESNWRTYLSSSEYVKEKLKNGEKLVKREILHWAYSLSESTYIEAKLQFHHEVLCNPLFLNKNITCKILRCVEEKDNGLDL